MFPGHIYPSDFIYIDENGFEKAKYNKLAVKSGWIIIQYDKEQDKVSIYRCKKPNFYYKDSFRDPHSRELLTEFFDYTYVDIRISEKTRMYRNPPYIKDVVETILQELILNMPDYQVIDLSYHDQCVRCFTIKKFVKERSYYYKKLDTTINFTNPLCTGCYNHLIYSEKARLSEEYKNQQKEQAQKEREQQEIKRLLNQKAYYEKIKLNDINQMSGFEFEEFVASRILPNLNYSNIEITSKTFDYGVDIVATSSLGKKTAFQCKRTKKMVGFRAIQEIYTAKTLFNCSEAIVITNSTFSRNANTIGPRLQVTLWDKHNLLEVM